MKALLLAGGYAMRLRPLTETVAKPLLPVGGRPMADWIVDAVQETGIEEIHVVTNAVYADAFTAWADGRSIVVHNDGTSSNDDRLGATGDIWFAIEHGGLLDDDLLVIAADNLFEFSLRNYIDFWAARGGSAASAIAVHRLDDPSLASLYGVVELGDNERVVGLEEKPKHPKSDLVSTATYIFGREHLPLMRGYLEAGLPPDPPGTFISWLLECEPLFGFGFTGEWLDIGNPSQLLAADNLYRVRHGMPPRDHYAL